MFYTAINIMKGMTHGSGVKTGVKTVHWWCLVLAVFSSVDGLHNGSRGRYVCRLETLTLLHADTMAWPVAVTVHFSIICIGLRVRGA